MHYEMWLEQANVPYWFIFNKGCFTQEYNYSFIELGSTTTYLQYAAVF